MTPILLAGPVIEPVTLADIKGYLRLDGNDEDRLIHSLITAARLMVEAESGRCLIGQTWRLVLDRWPPGGAIRLPLSPVSAIVAARVFGPDGIAAEVSPAALQLDGRADPPRVVVVGPVSAPGRAFSGIEIDVRAGHGEGMGDVPQPLRQAVRVIVARWFEMRGDDTGGVPAVPGEAQALIAPFRRARL